MNADAIRAALDDARADIGNPVWEPLTNLVGEKAAAGFMFMGAYECTDTSTGGAVLLALYKHGITRHYLNLDADSNPYTYRGGDYERGERLYQPTDTATALRQAFDGLDAAGATVTTAYDAAYRAARDAELRGRRLGRA